MSEEIDTLKSLLIQLLAEKYTLDDRIQEVQKEIDTIERGQHGERDN